MTAAFATWQPRYADHGIATFPVTGKRPGVKGYLALSVAGSRQLAMKFTDAEAFGYAVGQRSRIAVLDIDSPDEKLLTDAMSEYGASPIVVRSGSGNWQAWYRHNGEGRKIRPDPRRPIDILGAGFVVAPPSIGSRGRYQFVRGQLTDLERLPPMRTRQEIGKQIEAHRHSSPLIPGQRNDTLWRMAMRAAPHVDDLDALLDWCQTQNAESADPMSDAEVAGVAASAWKYESEGKNWIGTGRRVVVPHALIDKLATENPYAFALLITLRKHHWGRNEFVLANGTAESLKWTLRRFKDALDRLVQIEEIRCIHPGGRGSNDPPIYGWAKVSDFAHQ